MKPVALAIPIALLSLVTACSSSTPSTSSTTPAAAGGSSAAAPAGSVLTANVADPFSISLVDSTGAKVTSLKAGSYQVKVTDSSTKHNFHLTGPGVEEKTTVPGLKTTTWTVTLSAGTYTFQCDPHAARGMKGTFTVT
jgi:plastocyanin